MRRRLCALLILPQGYDVKAEPADKLVRLASTLAAAEIRNRYAGRERDGLLHRVALAVVIDGVFVRLVLLQPTHSSACLSSRSKRSIAFKTASRSTEGIMRSSHSQLLRS
jgi:hypothetical protein